MMAAIFTVLTVMKKVMMAERNFGWVEDCRHMFFPVCRVLRTCSIGLGRRGQQFIWTTFLGVLLKYRAAISRAKSQFLAFISYTWQWSCEGIVFGI